MIFQTVRYSFIHFNTMLKNYYIIWININNLILNYTNDTHRFIQTFISFTIHLSIHRYGRNVRLIFKTVLLHHRCLLACLVFNWFFFVEKRKHSWNLLRERISNLIIILLFKFSGIKFLFSFLKKWLWWIDFSLLSQFTDSSILLLTLG